MLVLLGAVIAGIVFLGPSRDLQYRFLSINYQFPIVSINYHSNSHAHGDGAINSSF